jgi:hypothetical protein
MIGFKPIINYLLSALASAEWPARTAPEAELSKYILIGNNLETDGATKDEFIQVGRVQVTIIERIAGNQGSFAAVQARTEQVINTIKPTVTFIPNVSGLHHWEVIDVLRPFKTFNGDSTIMTQICTIEYKYTKTP